ncbi:MAG: PD-(D/E)XK nuclease family protein, partial [bacterium]|nr:PD-(D/E)XK nuclease family protein [bacterium]
KIDRVDNKSNDEIEIIDYKTGKKPDDKKLKKSLQLSIYALAASHPSLYNRPITKISLTFYYLQDMEKVTMKREEGEMIQVKQDIVETVTQIRQSSFTPKVGPWCNFCAFRMICEAWQ